VHVLVPSDGQALVVDILGGGDIIGEMALLTGAPRTASARAATSVTLGQIKRDDFEHLMETQPELREKVWHEFAKRRFDNAVRGLPEFAGLSHDDRLTWFEKGELVEAPANTSHRVRSRDRFVFVALGTIRLGPKTHAAPVLVALTDTPQLETATEARFVLLVDPTVALAGEERPPPSSLALLTRLE
jgi:hypothetical protein